MGFMHGPLYPCRILCRSVFFSLAREIGCFNQQSILGGLGQLGDEDTPQSIQRAQVGRLIVQQNCSEQMQPEQPFKWNSKISAESKISNRSSIRSLDRGSWEDREPSLNKQHSLIEVMSLESSKKSDIYEKMLAEEPQQGVGSEMEKEEQRSFNPFKTVIKFAPEPINNRFSYDPKQELNHVCTCYEICNEQRCPCSYALDEECLEGYCCNECIQAKSKKAVRSGMQEPDPKTFCTCKKTKCNKKYCTCFAAGVKCGYNCSCEDCLNCDKPQKIEIQPVCIVDEEIKRLDMPESMEFQPFAFRFSANSNK